MKKYSNKCKNIVNEAWKFLENNYKGSEITMELLLKEICKRANTKTCLKDSIKYLWQNYEFFYEDIYKYYKNYIKTNFHIIVN